MVRRRGAAVDTRRASAWFYAQVVQELDGIPAAAFDFYDDLAANNTRFHKNLPPIKEHQGGVVHVEDAIAYYVQVSAAGLLTAGGW